MYVSWILVSTGVWLAGIFAIRYTLKVLLSYHAWMYEPRGKVSVLTKLWLVVHTAVTSRICSYLLLFVHILTTYMVLYGCSLSLSLSILMAIFHVHLG